MLVSILVPIVYFIALIKNQTTVSKNIKKQNANNFINGMSEENKHDMYLSRTFYRGFTVAKSKDGSYIFIKQAKLVDSGLFY